LHIRHKPLLEQAPAPLNNSSSRHLFNKLFRVYSIATSLLRPT
jgi:hypothetical protein